MKPAMKIKSIKQSPETKKEKMDKNEGKHTPSLATCILDGV